MKLWWRRVDYPLVRPLKVGGRLLHERSVLELKLVAKWGLEALGEASPLPGLHAERLETLPALLPAALELLEDHERPYDPLPNELVSQPAWTSLPPCLRLGLEAASEKISGVRNALRYELPTPPSTALFDGTTLDFTPELAQQRRVKVKVGRREMGEEIDLVRALRRALVDEAEIRLDANRAFSLEEAVSFARAIRDIEPVWIEEPVQDPADIPEFIDRSGLPVALDETLRDPRFATLGGRMGVAAWVVKPALFGLLGSREIFASTADLRNRPACVVSSCFEGTVGLALLAELAREAPGQPAPGLGTADWLGSPRHGRWIEVHVES